MNIETTIQKDAFAVKIEAKDNDKVVGWAFLYVLSNDRHDEPFGFLENVYVEPDYRKHGIGSQLVTRAIEEAKNHKCYKLLGTSRYSSENVHAWYEKMGFKNYGIEFRMDLKESNPKQVD